MLASVIPLSRRRRARAHQKQQQPCPPAAALPRLSARARVWLMCPCTWVRCCLVFRATQVQPRGQGGHELGRVVKHTDYNEQAKAVKDSLATQVQGLAPGISLLHQRGPKPAERLDEHPAGPRAGPAPPRARSRHPSARRSPRQCSR